MNKRLLGLVILAGLIVSFIVLAWRRTNTKGINIILISVDTLSADHMGLYGYTRNTTPNIDSFAKDATTFKNTYTLFPITPQSFYTLFSGREDFLKNNGNAIANVTKKGSETPFLAEILRSNGFQTAAFVTNPVLGTVFPTFREGFSVFDFANAKLRDEHMYESYNHDYQNAKLVVSNSVNWLEKNKGKRFFLWAHFDTPHTPYNPPNEYVKKFDPQFNPMIYANLLNDSFPNNTYLRSCSPNPSSPEIIRQAINLYDAEINTVDEQVGTLIKNLKRMGLYDRTIIVFYSDHGEGFDHNAFGHGDALYNSNMHIANIIRDPRYPEPSVIERPMSNKDILPTILGLLDIHKYDSDGTDISPLMKKPSLSLPATPIVMRTKKPVITEQAETMGADKFAVIDHGFKYIYSLNARCTENEEGEELYDLKKDYGETKNIIHTRQDIASEMKKIVKPYLLEQENLILEEKERDIREKMRSLGY